MGGEEWQEWIVLALLSWLYLIYQLIIDIFENQVFLLAFV